MRGTPGRTRLRGLSTTGGARARRCLRSWAILQCLPLVAAAMLAACGRAPGAPVRVIDFVKQVGHVDKRPIDAAVEPVEHIFGGRPRASLAVPVPSRLIWTTPLPEHAVLTAYAGLPRGGAPASARFRIGISDNRVYEGLGEWTLSSDPAHAGPEPISLDLSRFGGRRISLLFSPAGHVWRLVFSVDAVGGTGTAYWGEPGIDTDARSARAYFKRSTAWSSAVEPRVLGFQILP